MNTRKMSKKTKELFHAIELNLYKDIPDLINDGADLSEKNSEGLTPIHFAAKMKRWSCVVEIAKSKKTDKVDSYHYNKAYIEADLSGMEIVASTILEKGTTTGTLTFVPFLFRAIPGKIPANIFDAIDSNEASVVSCYVEQAIKKNKLNTLYCATRNSLIPSKDESDHSLPPFEYILTLPPKNSIPICLNIIDTLYKKLCAHEVSHSQLYTAYKCIYSCYKIIFDADRQLIQDDDLNPCLLLDLKSLSNNFSNCIFSKLQNNKLNQAKFIKQSHYHQYELYLYLEKIHDELTDLLTAIKSKPTWYNIKDVLNTALFQPAFSSKLLASLSNIIHCESTSLDVLIIYNNVLTELKNSKQNVPIFNSEAQINIDQTIERLESIRFDGPPSYKQAMRQKQKMNS